MQMSCGTAPSSSANAFDCTATNDWSIDACVGLFGSSIAFADDRKSLHPATLAHTAPTNPKKNALFIIGVSSRSAVESDRQHDRTRLRQIEVVHALRPLRSGAQLGLRIE